MLQSPYLSNTGGYRSGLEVCTIAQFILLLVVRAIHILLSMSKLILSRLLSTLTSFGCCVRGPLLHFPPQLNITLPQHHSSPRSKTTIHHNTFVLELVSIRATVSSALPSAFVRLNHSRYLTNQDHLHYHYRCVLIIPKCLH